MRRVRLVHWKTDEVQDRVERLRAVGCEVDQRPPAGPSFLRELGRDPPAAVVIDLSRLPSQGRDLALTIRRRKSTRQIPLVFVGGDPDKVARIVELLPDAVYTCWERIGDSLQEAISHPPAEPVVPGSAFAAYAGKPLVEKLGIKEGATVVLVDAPAGFRKTLGGLPQGVQLCEGEAGDRDLTVWFVRSGQELEGNIEKVAGQAGRGPLWIAWPKTASRMATDLTQQLVRKVGLAAGMVDYKICSVDETWSALLFTRRKSGG